MSISSTENIQELRHEVRPQLSRFKPKKAILPNGLPFYCVDQLEVPLLYREIFEEESYLKNGIRLTGEMTVFDVGANIGMFSFFASQRAKGAQVFSFEPLPPTFSALKKNKELHKMETVRLFNFGLSNQEGNANFAFYPYSAGWSTRYPFTPPEFKKLMMKNMKSYDRLPAPLRILFNTPVVGDLTTKWLVNIQLSHKTYPCQLKTLSHVIQENEVKQIDLLKIDVERSEKDILLGITETHWPRIQQLVVEVQSDMNKDNKNEIRQLLASKGYKITEVEANYLKQEDGVSTNSTIYALR